MCAIRAAHFIIFESQILDEATYQVLSVEELQLHWHHCPSPESNSGKPVNVDPPQPMGAVAVLDASTMLSFNCPHSLCFDSNIYFLLFHKHGKPVLSPFSSQKPEKPKQSQQTANLLWQGTWRRMMHAPSLKMTVRLVFFVFVCLNSHLDVMEALYTRSLNLTCVHRSPPSHPSTVSSPLAFYFTHHHLFVN